MGIVRPHVLLESTAAVTGDWVALDTRYDDVGNARSLQILLTVGDTVVIEGTTQDVKGIDKSFLDDLTTQDISVLGSYTANDELNLTGTWTFIRATKSGVTGPAKVQGNI